MLKILVELRGCASQVASIGGVHGPRIPILCEVLGLASKLSIFLIYSMVPEISWNFLSIELMRVFRVETEPSDLSSDVIAGFSEWVIESGMQFWGRKREEFFRVDHFRVVLLPRWVETESPSFPYPEEGNTGVVVWGGDDLSEVHKEDWEAEGCVFEVMYWVMISD